MKPLFITLCMLMFIAVTSPSYSADKVVVVPMGSSAKVGVDPSDIVSYHTSLTPVEDKTVFTVPSDKNFMLTDIVGHGDFVIKENQTRKTMVWLHDVADYAGGAYTITEQSVNFNSGIPFAPGTDFKVGELEGNHAEITISGYYF